MADRTRNKRTLAEKLTQYDVDPDTGCWIWQRALSDTGYGSVQMDNGKIGSAHRASYELHVGPIPEGMEVRHACHRRACINPEHLSVGTRADNMRDMVAAGRENPWGRAATECRRGHPFDEENTYHYIHSGDGGPRRMCRTCQRERHRKRLAG